MISKHGSAMTRARQALPRQSEGQRDRASKGAALPEGSATAEGNSQVQPRSAFEDKQTSRSEVAGTSEGDQNSADQNEKALDPNLTVSRDYAADQQQARVGLTGQSDAREPIEMQGARSVTDTQRWVRIPYPLSSFFQQTTFPAKPAINPDGHVAAAGDTSTRDAGTGGAVSGDTASGDATRTYQNRGWFDLGASRMRELTVESLEAASDSVNDEPSLKPKADVDKHE